LTLRSDAWHPVGVSDTFVEVGPKGRIVIPAAIRRDLGIHEGTQLAVVVDAGGIVLMPRGEVKRRLRALFATAPGSLARELIDERRADADRERSE
jgi:AbrB family looped-hinge helix DNA binding protein